MCWQDLQWSTQKRRPGELPVAWMPLSAFDVNRRQALVMDNSILLWIVRRPKPEKKSDDNELPKKKSKPDDDDETPNKKSDDDDSQRKSSRTMTTMKTMKKFKKGDVISWDLDDREPFSLSVFQSFFHHQVT
jgi:hypothetical protein